jgi:AhpD family alkylhydroperoxidase
MKTFTVPTKDQVSPVNQTLFDNLTKMVGHVPNLFATFAYSDNALANYLTLQSGKTSLRAKEREIVNLVVSQVNKCLYCLSAHTAIAKMQGFTDEQVLEIRRTEITFDAKFDALAKLVKSISENQGHAAPQLVENFYAAGYNDGSLADVVMAVGDKIITNYMFALTAVPIDFPVAPEL